ncbi:MAG: hypothetical protein ABWY14_14415 [Tardiphaga sp.]
MKPSSRFDVLARLLSRAFFCKSLATGKHQCGDAAGCPRLAANNEKARRFLGGLSVSDNQRSSRKRMIRGIGIPTSQRRIGI